MIDIDRVWLPEMASLCELILDDQRLWNTWICGHIETGISDYDDLYTVLMEDLEAPAILTELLTRPRCGDLHQALSAVCERLVELDKWVEEGNQTDELILRSPGWRRLQHAAEAARLAFAKLGISRDDLHSATQ